jgi:TolB-like protein
MKKYLMVSLLVAGCSLAFAQSERKTAVAVMDLRGSGISETDAKFLTERLIIELQRTDVFDVLERDKMDEILKEQGFQQTGACDQASCLVEAGRMLPVQKMIGGSVGKFGETYSVQIKMIDLKTAKVEKTAIKDFSEKMDYLLTSGMASVSSLLAGNNKIISTAEKINTTDVSSVIDSTVAEVVKVIIGKESPDKYDKLILKKKGLAIDGKSKVFINKGIMGGIKKGDWYKIFRVEEINILVDPATKKVLDKKTIIIDVAYLKVDVVEDQYAECSTLDMKEPVKVGDKVYKTNVDIK